MRLCIIILGLMLAGCGPMGGGDEALPEQVAVLKCPPEMVEQEPVEAPAYKGKRFDKRGTKKLVTDLGAAIDSRDAVIQLWQDAWKEC